MNQKYRKEFVKKYPEYNVWRSVKKRCYYKKHPYYEYYGGKGIKVCDRWLVHGKGFYNFLEGMGRRPSNKHELDRIDSDKDYCKENCRWLSRFKNRSRVRGKDQYLDKDLIEEEEVPF